MSLDEVIDTYCEVWSETDRERRARLLSSVWSAAATYTDPTVDALNGESLLDHIERIQATRPGARVIRSTNVDEHHGCARFGFQVVGADGAILREGSDIALVSADARRIDRIIGFFGPLAALTRAMPQPFLPSGFEPEQLEVWRRVHELWDLAVKKDEGPIREALHPAYVGWDMSAPLPHDRDTAVQSVCGSPSPLVGYELEPLSIAVYEGCTAVVHYRYRATLAPNGSPRTEVAGNWTEIYVKHADHWLMAAVSGRPNP